MDMDNQHRRLSDSNVHKLELENEIIFSAIKQSADIPESYNSALSIAKPPNHALSMDSDRVMKYLNHILLEDDIDDENNHDSFCDPVALRAAESSLYEAMHDKHSSHFETSVGSLKYGDDCTDLHPRKSFVASDSSNLSIQPSSCQTDSDGLNPYLYDINSALISRMDAYLSSADSIPNKFCDVGDETILHFKRGVEEASNFLPAGGRLVIKFDNYPLPPEAEELTRGVAVNIEEHTADSRRGRKHYCSNENVLEERSRKHAAVHNEDAVKLSEVFDKVFLCTDDDDDSPCGVSHTQQQRGRSGPKSYSKKQGQVVDLSALLTRCAKYVAVGDYRAAIDELKKIGKHSSPTGDASQRLAHAFADALEARLTGCGTQLYVPSFRNTISVSGLIKSHMSSSLPFMRLIYLFSNQMIYEAASRGSSLHVIDFGILHGMQWPTLIRDLSRRPGAPQDFE
ncbi:unnamed protein product [Cuscuta epithymum]|uniref:Uncharacterized protein n=1 Tax=Cuscuta epithymum TaxID=186058 RepID=A0AAV0G834_9ASTE|nr:unnamed protein product [Cuscuta epithymum]